MGRIADYFKNFKQRYDAQIIRNQKMDEFLANSQKNSKQMDDITSSVEKLNGQLSKLSNKVDDLQEHIEHIDGRLEVIGKGTKMELFDTLYHWKKILTERGWKTREEMREVEEIYSVYHDGLGGNGQGQAYYEAIKALEERDPA